MKLWRGLLASCFIALLGVVFGSPALAAEAADFAIPKGWFYTQAGGGEGRGFSVADNNGIEF